MLMAVGLGNPGAKYELTRHNLGFLVVDGLATGCHESFSKNFHGEVTTCHVEGTKILGLKPQTFMNLSGKSVLAAMSFYKLKPQDIIVIHDELDLPLGEIRIKKGGGNGGHNGLKDISQKIGPDFIRLRLGISRPKYKGTEADYVLHNFSSEELEVVEKVIQKSLEALKVLALEGLVKAQETCQGNVLKEV